MLCSSALITLAMLLSPPPQSVHLSIAPPPRLTTSDAETGLVLLQGEIDASGKVDQLQVNQGTGPYRERSLESVRQWTFEPREKKQSSVPLAVVMLFRARTDLPNSAFEFPVPAQCEDESAPQLLAIINPGYPLDSAAEGTVIVQMQIDEEGRVRETNVISAVPSLTTAAVDAVSQWRFRPAQHQGRPSYGVVVAVISFPRPAMTY